MLTRRILPLAVFAFILVLIPLFLSAVSVGRIKGTVVDDKTGEPLAGVSVQIDGTTMGAKTNFDGDFVIIGVPPGTYNLILTSIGYKSVKVTDVVVDTNQTTERNLRMIPSTIDMGVTEVKGLKKGTDLLGIGTIKTQKEIIRDHEPVGDRLSSPEAGHTQNCNDTGQAYSGINESRNKMRKFSGGSPKVDCEMPKTHSEVRWHPIVPKPKPAPPPRPYHCPTYYYGTQFDDMFFKNYGTNPFVDTEVDNLSTFAIDVDDASYVMARSYLERGELPPRDAIRVEEFVNRFDYDYYAPHKNPFTVNLEGAPSRFGRSSHLLRIGIKGREIPEHQRKPANLVFVIDVSGSMNREGRLELVKNSLYFLVDELEKHDRVGIVTFNHFGQEVLPLTPVRHRSKIFKAIEWLSGSGSTNAGEGLRLGYDMARREFDNERINRVILCSDGVANTGTTNPDELLRRIKRSADKGITLSTIGVGMGNYNDVLLEKLGNKGNGNYAYVDDLEEAKRVFVENLSGTLEVIARDVKIQVDFDPEVVHSYRLLGFENRAVADHQFRNDRVDGGEIGAGHEVTAVYEIKLEWNSSATRLGKVFIRFKDADGRQVAEISRVINRGIFNHRFDKSTPKFKLAAASAEFAEILKGTPWTRGNSLRAVHNLTREIYAEWPSPQVKELMNLIERADRLLDTHAER
jgi:Ca-activated chloride channel family protein